MSAAGARHKVTGRHVPRYPLAIPVDVNIVRSGAPESIPGRCLDLGEGGLAAVLAAELHPEDSIGVSFRLPHVSLSLQAKAVVRHKEELTHGMEFLSLSPEQQAMLCYWIGKARAEQAQSSPVSSPPSLNPEAEPSQETLPISPRPLATLRVAPWLVLAAFTAVAGVGWWQWRRAWQELESRIPGRTAVALSAHAEVSPAVMQQLLTHKVDPVYPEAAREKNVQGVVVLKAMIGPDGSVIRVRPLNGPDILAPAAMDAVRWWRFQPYRINGKPVQVETTLAVEFRPAS